MNGKRNKLKLGYCIVRNRSQIDHDSSSFSRGTKEQDFFNSEPWSKLPRDRVGVGSLKTLLKDLLAEIVEKEFPKIKIQLDRDLIQAKNQLASIGTERTNDAQQNKYLQTLAAKFEKISTSALRTDYYQHEILKDDRRLRLPTLIADRSDQFVEEIRTKGHTIGFHEEEDEESDDEESDDDENEELKVAASECGNGDESDDEELEAAASEYENGEGKDEDENERGGGGGGSNTFSLFKETTNDKIVILKAPVSVYEELDNILQHSLDIPSTTKHGILDWIKAQYRESRGYSLQVIGLNILPMLWQKQSHNWEVITFSFMNDAIAYVHDFIRRLLLHICPETESKVADALLSFIMDDLVVKYKSAIQHVKFILQVERRGTLLTKNRNFGSTLKEMRNARLIKAIKGSTFTTTKMNGVECIPIKAIEATAAALAASKGNLDNAVEDTHDYLHAYYNVAMARFVDTVMAQGIDDYLLTGENSPIKIITPAFIASMTPAQREHIAGEDPATTRKRRALTEEIAALERGKEVLRA